MGQTEPSHGRPVDIGNNVNQLEPMMSMLLMMMMMMMTLDDGVLVGKERENASCFLSFFLSFSLSLCLFPPVKPTRRRLVRRGKKYKNRLKREREESLLDQRIRMSGWMGRRNDHSLDDANECGGRTTTARWSRPIRINRTRCRAKSYAREIC